MAEYIEREPILKFIEDGLNNPDKLKAFGHDAIEIMTEVQYAPAAGVAPVVRCKDCKHRGTEECPMVLVRCCDDGDGHFDYVDEDETEDYGFCYRGDRRADNG